MNSWHLVEKVFQKDDYDLTTQFFYFLLLFRDMPHLQEYINSPRFGASYLEKFIIFVYGFCALHDQTTGRILDDILYFISSERLLELAMNSVYVSKDKLLLFFILTKLDTKELNMYFASIKDINQFQDEFHAAAGRDTQNDDIEELSALSVHHDADDGRGLGRRHVRGFFQQVPW